MSRWARLGLACLALALAGPLAADEDERPELGMSGVPIAGFDQKNGWVFGAAGFVYSDRAPGINAGLFAVSNFDAFHSATFNLDERSLGPWSYSLHLLAEHAFDRYYGEGDLTSARSSIYIRQDRLDIKPTLFYSPVAHLRLGVTADFRGRHEPDSRWFPDEATTAWGLRGEWEGRDKLINTRRGFYALVGVSRDLAGLGFTQWDADLRRFWRLRRDLTLGERVVVGFSDGSPSYLFRYRLGGLDLLRGYTDNRFRGGDMLVTQSELRWILWKWLSVNASVDGGDIRDDAFHQWKASAQVGLRIGLPPGWGQKLRLDYGVGADQSTLQFQFGEIF
jgi:hypothetical protein